jgi:hypothetical protein
MSVEWHPSTRSSTTSGAVRSRTRRPRSGSCEPQRCSRARLGVGTMRAREDVPAEVGRYLRHLRVERGLAAATIDAYARDLRAYIDHLDGRGVADVRTRDPGRRRGVRRAPA